MIANKIKEHGVDSKRIVEYSFDSMQYEDIKTARLLYDEIKRRLAPSGKTYLFLDEIQEVESWERAVNSFMTDFDVDIYVTGSNSRMLSSVDIDIPNRAVCVVSCVPIVFCGVLGVSCGIW